MNISAAAVKELRDMTGAGMMDCKRALKDAEGDLEKAKELLRKKGLKVAEKRSARVAKEGWIGSYIHHGGRVGVLMELRCETDFVSKTDAFQDLLKDLCMQVAAMSPVAATREGIPPEVTEKEKAIYIEQIDEKKRQNPQICERILEGKLKKFYKDCVLLEQPFIKDDKITVRERMEEVIGKLGEKIEVGRFARFELGQ
jgi:elongation factor Ts